MERALFRCANSYSSRAASGASPCRPETICSISHIGKNSAQAGNHNNGAHSIPNAHIKLTANMNTNVAPNAFTSRRLNRPGKVGGS